MTKKILILLFLFTFFTPTFVFAEEPNPEPPAAVPPPIPAPVLVPNTCTCAFSLRGACGDIDKKLTYQIGSSLKIEALLNEIEGCWLVKQGVGLLIDTQQTISITPEACEGSFIQPTHGSALGVDYDIACSASGDAASPGSTPSGTVSKGNTLKTPPSVRLINPIGGKYPNEGDKETDADAQGNSNIQTIIGNAIQVTLRLLGAITLAVFFYGGFMWLTSAGSSDKIQKGTKTMTYAVIGLFIIFGAYGILTTIISGITNSPQVSKGPSPEDEDFATCTEIEKEEKCKDAASIGCVWAALQIPDGEKLDACVPQNEKVDTCINFAIACISAREDDPQGEINCQNAAISCKTN